MENYDHVPEDGKIFQDVVREKNGVAQYYYAPLGQTKQQFIRQFWITLQNGNRLLIEKRYAQTLHHYSYSSGGDYLAKSPPKHLSTTILLREGITGLAWDESYAAPEPERIEEEDQ